MNKESFVLELNKRGISCEETQLNLLWDFMRHVLKTNESFNLTAIKDEESFVEKMIFDSALLLNNQNFEGIDILDIGAGAGFPSVVLSILSPKAHVFALDSTAKKVKFIEDYAKEKSLDVTGIAARYNQALPEGCGPICLWYCRNWPPPGRSASRPSGGRRNAGPD